MALSLACRYECFQVLYLEGRMSFLSWPEVGLDAEVNFERSGLKPCATTLSEVRRLRCFRDTQDTRVKGSRFIFLAGRHRQLHMIETSDIHNMGTLNPNA